MELLSINQPEHDQHLTLGVGSNLNDMVKLWASRKSTWSISIIDSRTFYIDPSQLRYFDEKEVIIFIREIFPIVIKIKSRAPSNRYICTNNIQNKLNEIFVGLKSHFDVELDYAWKTKKMYNGIKADDSFC